MLNFRHDGHIWLCLDPTDMRKSFLGLSAMTRQVLKQNPLSGDWFVFVNRRRTLMKVLYFAAGGYCLWCKRLEEGSFAQFNSGEMTVSELLLLIEGVEIKASSQRRRFTLKKSSNSQ